VGEFDGFDLDRSTSRAWSLFANRLADHVVNMAEDSNMCIEVESTLDDDEDAGAAPYVQFCAWGGDLVRCEVSSNEYLDVAYELSGDDMVKLAELGWHPPGYQEEGDEPDGGSPNFSLDLERRQGDRLAVMTVKALREVFGVPHPAFLSAGNVLDPSDYPDLGIPLTTRDSEGAGDEPLAVMPTDAGHLRSLVDLALTPAFGHTPNHDSDDDVPVVSGSALVFVRVNERLPVVDLFSTLVCDVVDLEEAAQAVAELNRDVSMIKFMVHENSVVALVRLPSLPFAPLHLRSLLEYMSSLLDQVDDDLVARLGGRRALEESGTEDPPNGPAGDEELPPELLTLVHLDPEGAGVEPDLAASVCGYDRDLVLRFLKISSEQEIAWRTSRDEAAMAENLEDAAACEQEAAAWAVTFETLRHALGVIVERRRETG
jgi:hypothetical protein